MTNAKYLQVILPIGYFEYGNIDIYEYLKRHGRMIIMEEMLNMEKSHLHIGRLCQNVVIYGQSSRRQCAKQ